MDVERLEQDYYKNIKSSLLASLISRTVFHPFDTIKTNLQYSDSALQLKNLKVFKGLGVSLLLSSPAGAIYFTSYDYVKEWIVRHEIINPDSSLLHLAAGACAEGIASILFTPMDVVKQKLQVSTRSTVETLKKLYRERGLSGFYRGYFLTQAVFIPFTATYFVGYEKCKIWSLENTSNTTLNIYQSFGCSLIAASLSSLITNPVDVVKTRIQIRSHVPAAVVVKELIQTHGIFGTVTRGVTARILWAAPSMSVSVSLWEYFKTSNILD